MIRHTPKNRRIVSLNISKDDDYHTQINNKLIPIESCNTTAMIMYLKNSGVSFETPAGMQEEDYLTQMLLSDEAKQEMEIRAPWAVGKYSPNEVHVMLEWAVNKIITDDYKSVFSENSTMESIIDRLVLDRHSTVVSGSFTRYGHVVCVSGILTFQEDIYNIRDNAMIDYNKVIAFIIDDPFGDYHTGYRDRRGNNIRIPLETFNKLTNKSGERDKKWTHQLHKK